MEMTKELFNALVKEGYECIRMLPGGEASGIKRFIHTWAIVVGIDKFGYRCRYCYETQHAAYIHHLQWEGKGDPPGPWIKKKGRDENGEHVDLLNPTLGKDK
jgi:hypothetical protein